MSSTHIEQFMSAKLAQALANNLFPELDSQLRAGRHIGVDDLDNHAFLMDFQDELEGFYARYNVELVRAPEGFFYLRPRSTTLIPRSVLSELEMLVGKVLCYLYLSPERLANQGIFSTAELYEELLSLADEAKLLKVVNNRSTGSDLDKQKLLEKTRGALNRLRRLGMITFVSADNSQFVIAESVFRFGADVRSGDDPREAQLRLIRDGEAQSLAEDEKHPRPEDQDDDNEESDNDNATDEAEDEE
ncbi:MULTISPECIES: chromosome partition protein MukE [Morganella]|uniref:Chromosome partition protein MukE n=1 Tax=bacterium 19GA11TI05 TaxID=2920688 RepID=A0AAU6TY49_UNCXX|nr:MULTISPECIES: chromosome partition protein MukE [Morganella]EME8470062.1 chromosome partition protein MukE [Morganella morganii]MBC3995627.1 chromosome partition protein MukE [Morganella morganii]MBS5193899.1 chromosome partition protein MukE [Morganella morganii]MBT0381671.1 chromosome partition protein MukE [Morganella morganii subsp. morganii]MBT0384171.1 chromosome partition protein MukE [Morganella morganii subsp. morganii]